MIYILNKSTPSIRYLYNKDKKIAKVIDLVGTISYKPYTKPYSFLIETILGQMLSNKVADILTARLKKLCNGQITPKAINNLTDNQIKAIGTSNSKVKYIRELTIAVINKKINFNKLKSMNDEETIKILTSIKGIGTWSAKMYLIFVLNRKDILPYEDMAFIQGYKWCYNTTKIDKSSITKKFNKLSPYRSIVARYFYKALDWGYTKNKI